MKTGNIEDFVEFTTRIGCINNCKYCPQTLLIQKYTERSKEYVMTFNTFKTIIDKIPKELRIDFSGLCEPWLNKECTKMLLYAYDTGHERIGVFTTGVGMSIKDVEDISHIPFHTFVLHLPDKEGNTSIKIDEKYMDVLAVMKRTKIHNFKTMSMGEPLYGLDFIFQDIRRSPMHARAGNINTEDVKPDNYFYGQISCLGDVEPKRSEILPNGDVCLCCNDYGLQHIIGNLLIDNYEDLYKSDEFKKVVKELKQHDSNTLCRSCIYTTPIKGEKK